MKTFTGLNKETPCACGCGQRMPANPSVQVVVDMDSRPWRRYIPGHEPRPSRNYRGKPEQRQPASAPAPTPPAPAGPTPTPPQPQVEPAPVPAPKVTTGVAPSLADNKPWKILTVTISVGDYTSVKAGVADFGRENETLAQLGSRLVAELTNDIRTELDVVHQVQAGKPLSAPASRAGALSGPADPRPVPTPGAVSAPTNLSAPTGAAPTAKGVVGPEMMETRRQVSMELESDISVTRSIKKRKAGNQWLKAHGYESFEQVLPMDHGALKELLVQFEAINVAVEAVGAM